MMNKFRHKKVTSMAAGLPVTSLGHLKEERERLGGSAIHDEALSGLPGHGLFRGHRTSLSPRLGKGLVANLGMDFSHCPLVTEPIDWWNGGANGFTQRLSCSPHMCCPNRLALFCCYCS